MTTKASSRILPILGTLALVLSGAATPASADHAGSPARQRCNPSMLQGVWGGLLQGELVGVGPMASVGLQRFRADGTFDGRFTTTAAGQADDTARGLAVEDFGGGIVGFRLPQEGAAEAEAPAKLKGGGRRKAAAGRALSPLTVRRRAVLVTGPPVCRGHLPHCQSSPDHEAAERTRPAAS